MPSLSPLEVVTVAVVALIVFGPQKLPQIARQIGRALNEVRRMASDVKSEFDSGLRYDDEDEEPRRGEPSKGDGKAPEEDERGRVES
jgi:sec-independent protein translocase protein TatB